MMLLCLQTPESELLTPVPLQQVLLVEKERYLFQLLLLLLLLNLSDSLFRQLLHRLTALKQGLTRRLPSTHRL